MKSITIAGGEREKIISRFSSSLQMTYRFNARPLNAGEIVSGKVEISGSDWIFPKPTVTQPLGRENEVRKGAWDTYYSVTVEPDCDVTVTMERNSLGGVSLFALLAAVVAIAAASAIIVAGVI